MNDPINHPGHYTDSHPGMECIQLTETLSFCLGNTVKYAWRHQSKDNPLTDLEKAAWYLDHALDRHEPAPQWTSQQDLILNQLEQEALDDDRHKEAEFWHSLRQRHLIKASTALAGMIHAIQDDTIQEDLQ